MDDKKNRKKILIYSIAYAPFWGGAEVAWKEITDRLEIFEFHMITPRYRKNLPSLEKIGNITVHRIGLGNSLDKMLLVLWGPLLGLILNHRYNFSWMVGIIYNHASLAAAMLKILRPKIPFILNLQDGDTDEVIEKKTRGIKFMSGTIYKKPDVITAIAKFLEKRAQDNGSIAKIELIPNGVNISLADQKFSNNQKDDLREHLGITNDDKIVITTSRLNYKNAIDDLIKSFAYLPANYKLLILGEGEEKEKLSKLVKEEKLDGRIIFVGFVKHEEIYKYLAISDVFCRPSLQEGLGNSFLEAMAAGVPVVATPVGGIPDFLLDGETGLFCKVKDTESIAQKISILAENDDLRKKIIQNGILLIHNKYDWEAIADSYRQLFDSQPEKIR